MDFRIQNGVLVEYTGNGGDVVIPDSVTIIGDSAFEYCRRLASVTVTRGSYANKYCKRNNLPVVYAD